MLKDTGADYAALPASDHLLEVAQLYDGRLAPEMEAFVAALEPRLAAVVDEFYLHLNQFESANALIRCLSEPELAHLKRQQGRHLLFLSSAGLDCETHRAASTKIGRIHAILGLRRRDLAHSLEILHAAVGRHIDEAVHHRALAVLSKRLIRDLTWQIDAALTVQAGYQRALLKLTELVWSAKGHADLINQAAAILGEVDGVVGCSFGRPDGEGVFRFESFSGERLKHYLADLESSSSSAIMLGSLPQGRGPTGRAWESGLMERCINVETDERMAPWREISRRHGIHSSLAVPICPPNRTPTTILTMYSELPGGYASPEQIAFVTQAQTLLTFAVSRLENGPGLKHALPWSTRQRWANLVGTSALEMHYQPIRSLGSGEANRAEALVRLRDADRLLTPGMFFPALSRKDFLTMYTRGLEQVLAQQNLWLEQGLDLQVSVNLPMDAIADMRYFEITRRLLHEYGPRPHRLALEVLETEDFPSGDSAAASLENFRSLQITLAEDDLGSGHSSLARLRTLPFDVVKIDRSILQGLDRSPLDTLSTVYQLTELCHALGKQVVVEGVEHEDLIEAIALLGVDAAQGYAIARPMAAAQLTQWMAGHRERRLADPPRPVVLVKLARLLLWESHLRLLMGKPQSRVYQIRPGPQPVLPFQSVDPSLQTALLDTAARHGVHGPQYAQARRRLIAAISDRP